MYEPLSFIMAFLKHNSTNLASHSCAHFLSEYVMVSPEQSASAFMKQGGRNYKLK